MHKEKKKMNEKYLGILVVTLLIVFAFSVTYGKEDDPLDDKNIHGDIVHACINPDEHIFKQINTESYGYSIDSYLIDTEWGQHGYYKSKCPWTQTRPPEQCRLGCWSVAIGQIINYHHNYYNLQSQGFVDYWCTETWIDPQHIVNDLNAYDYDWSQMVNKLVDSSSVAEKDNVSRLLFDTATVIQKDFGTDGYCTFSNTTNLNILINELVDHFKGITAFTYWDNNLTESEIVYEIDHGRPIMFYTIGHDLTSRDSFGHAWIIDGYRYNDSGKRLKFEVHFNYGWAGGNPDSLANSWYYYYGEFPTYDNNSVFDETDYRKGLLIRLSPIPPSLYGPSSGVAGKSYDYTATTIYDVNPPLYYKFDWGDGTFTDWLGRYDSGEPCVASHVWREKGIYDVRVKAKDVDGWESDWATLEVTIPKNKAFNMPSLIQWLIEHCPILSQIFQELLIL